LWGVYLPSKGPGWDTSLRRRDEKETGRVWGEGGTRKREESDNNSLEPVASFNPGSLAAFHGLCKLVGVWNDYDLPGENPLHEDLRDRNAPLA
jgi:hypothetical protein